MMNETLHDMSLSGVLLETATFDLIVHFVRKLRNQGFLVVKLRSSHQSFTVITIALSTERVH